MLKYKLKKLPRKKTIVWATILLLFVISISSIVRYYASYSDAINTLGAHSSGRTDTTLYVNDLEADWNYYMGLNYTKVRSKTALPSFENEYREDNLVAVKIVYDGTDVNHYGKADAANFRGKISNSANEGQYILEYYKYYPAEGSGANRYVDIELIDNPYAVRPNGLGFNGWVCNGNAYANHTGLCANSTISYDDTYYTRYIRVIVGNSNTATLYLNASWTTADVRNSTPTNFSSKVMKQVPVTNHTIYLNYDRYEKLRDDYAFKDGVTYLNTTRHEAGNNTAMNNQSGGNQVFYQYRTSNNGSYSSTYTLAASGTRCNYNRCRFYDSVPVTVGNVTQTPTNYAVANGNAYLAITNNNASTYFDVIPVYDWVAKTAVNIGTQTDPIGLADMSGFYYQTTAGGDGYYSNTGTTSGSRTYKLIQFDDTNIKDTTESDYVDYNYATYNTYVSGDPQLNQTRFRSCNKDSATGTQVDCKINSTTYASRMSSYYYLVTRDINIYQADTGAVNRPMTVENHEYTDNEVSNDLAIIGTGNGSYAELGYNLEVGYHNFKIGRYVDSGSDSRTITGSSGSTSGSMKVIVESGTYRDLLSKGNGSQSSTAAKFVYGSDYDRVMVDNSKLTVRASISASKSSGDATSTSTTPSSAITVKSGTIGTAAGTSGTNGNTESYYTIGIYVGSWSASSNNTALRTLTVEGGVILNINGGPCVASNINGNAIAIYVKGGVISSIFGGAGQTATYGNRIISVTGGQVTNSVAGGSNGNVNSGGAMRGNTLVYIGGNAKIGYKDSDGQIPTYGGWNANNDNWAKSTYYELNSTQYGNYKGSVFGAGLGQSGSTDDGVVNNSHVIINGGTVYGSVFGGGNFGTTGLLQTNTDSSATIDLLGGTVEGSVYGAGNRVGGGNASAGSGSNNTSLSNNYYVRNNSTARTVETETQSEVYTCRVNGNNYCTTYSNNNWGNAVTSTSSSTNVENIPAGAYLPDGTHVTSATACDSSIGTTGNFTGWSGWSGYTYSDGPYVYNYYYNYYGNNATRTRTRSRTRTTTCNYYTFTQVNAGSSYNPNATYYEYIDGEYVEVEPEYSGVATNTYRHEINITLNGGTVNNSIFGGSNIEGTVYGNVNINMIKGTVNGASSGIYGGGYGSSTKVLGNTVLESETTDDSVLHVNEVYGGSSQGQVNQYGATSVTINGGTFTTVYGGGKGENNNTPTSYGDVTVEIKDGSIGDAFNGNNVLGQPNGTMNIKVSGGEVGNVYGGSNGAGASAGTTHVLVTGGTIGNVFGGGKKAETSGTTHVNIQGGTFTDTTGGTYGGGNEAKVRTSVITVTGGTYEGTCGAGASVFGGGNKVVNANNVPIDAVTASSTVNINSGANVANVYGGSNKAGLVAESFVNANSGTINCNVYGGGFEAKTEVTHVSLKGSTFSAIATGTPTQIADAVNGNAFGGGKSANAEETHITLEGATLNNVYGGSNQVGLVDSSEVIITSGKAINVFGGNNAGGATIDTKVTIDGSADITDVFGGSNGMGAIIGFYEEAISGPYEYESTSLENMYEGSTLVEIKSGTVKGNVYGGGNKAIVVGDATVNITGGTVKQNVFGGGNEAHIGTPLTRFSVIIPVTGDPNTNTGKFDESSPNSNNKVTVNIVNGAVEGNVFGSGNVAFIHGDTYVNIGAKALNELGLNSNTSYGIDIDGNVFGGSYSISKEDDSYTYDSIGVGGSTNVNIDSTGYYTNNETRVHVSKSVYGEGNNSSVTKKANIVINNHGTIEHPATMLLIARATDVMITDSFIELNGDRDKAQYIDKKKYSFVTINNLYLLGSDGSNSTGTTLYLFGGGKELKNLYSGYFDGATFTKQTLTGSTPNGSDNRIYMAPSKVLYVSTGEAYASTPGYVNGIAFLGMYHHSGQTIQTGIYDPNISDYVTNGVVSEEKYNEFSPKSDFTYVYGSSYLKGENGAQTSSRINITEDGFYTNYAEENTREFSTDYVGVTPEEENYYEWVIGNRSLEIEVHLEASKYSMKSYQDVSIRLDNLLGWKNAVITLDSVNTAEFGGANIENIASTVTPFQTELISKTNVPVINEGTDPISGVTNANRVFGLTMGTTTDGWLANYSTDFTGSAGMGDTITGDKVYYYDSTTNIRDLSFWLHSSKNIDMGIIDPEHPDDDIYLGVVKIDGSARQKNPLAEGGEIKYDITISVHISLTDGDFDGYGYNIAPGKKYNSFASRPTTIGSDGAFSIYQSLSMDLTKPVGTNDTRTWKSLLYGQNSDYQRYLKSGVLFPAGTRITMIDLITNEQYFYTTTGSEQMDQSGNYIYSLDDFVSMSNVSGSQKYFADELGNVLTGDPDVDGDLKYYNKFASGNGSAELQTEEFIFTVDFSSVANMPNAINSYLYMEIEDKTNAGNPSVSLATGNPRDAMAYAVVNSGSNTIETEGGFLNNPSDINSAVNPETNFNIYRQRPATLYLNTRLNTSGSVDNYTDTKYDDYKLGVNIRFKKVEEDDQGNIISTTDVGYNVLEGLVITSGDESYSPESDGTIKLALAGRISNVASNLRFDFSRVSESEFEFGKYQVCVDPFGSYDGLYAENDHDSGQEVCFNFELLNDNFGIVATTEPVMITHDVLSGEDEAGNRAALYKVKEINGLANPRLRVSISRLNDHTGNDYSNIDYTPKDLCDFAVTLKIQGASVDCSSAPRYIVDGVVYYDLGPIAKNTETTYNVEITYKVPTTSDISSPDTSLWRSGTYKVNFSIFDGDGGNATLMGGDYEYLIIRKLDIEELVADSGSGG